jgi:hypothetical protein
LQDSKRQFETQLDFAKRPKDLTKHTPNGLRYPRWGGRRDAVRLGKCWGEENCLESRQTPQRRVHALLARSLLFRRIEVF